MMPLASNPEGNQPDDTRGKSPQSARPFPPIPDHALLRRIGSGSYGEVWLARNMMGVYRAVKIVYRKSFEDQRPFERELSGIRKFEPISRSHDGFIDVLHVGIHEKGDYFYYVMELGDDETTGIRIEPTQYHPKTLGRTLTMRGHLSYQECLHLGLDLSRALGELHRNGLVHRDVKPSNIIFVNGVPKLADIGLVAGTDEARSYVGTEGFIPPEGPGTPRADVYALGKVLYECVTGKDRQDYPELPAEWDKAPDHDRLLELNEILLHACNVEISQCYKSAEDMHADLVVLLNGRSVRRLKSLERQLARLKRIGATAALVTVLLGIISFWVYREMNMAAKAREGQVRANIAYGNQAMESGDLLSALPYFSAAMDLDRGNQSRESQHQLRFASVLAQCPKIVQMFFISNEVDSVSLSPDGKRVLFAGNKCRARIFDIDSGKPLTPVFGQASNVLKGAFSPSGELVVTASEDKTACLWRSSDGSLITNLLHPAELTSAAFSPDGQQLATAGANHEAWVWDTRTWTHTLKLVGHSNVVRCVTYSHDGKLIATASDDHTARIWNSATGRELLSFSHPDWVTFVTFGPDDRTLLTGCDDHYARVWNVDTDLITDLRIPPKIVHPDVVSSGGASPDGRYLVTGCLDGAVRLWLMEDHVPRMPIPVLWHSDRVTDVAFATDGHRIVSACIDGTVRVWDLAGCTTVPQPLTGIFNKDMDRFLAVNSNGFRVLDAVSNQPVSPPVNANGRIANAALSDNGRFVITLSFEHEPTNEFDGILQAWDAQNGHALGTGIHETNAVTQVRISDDGMRLLTFGTNFLKTWQVDSGKLLALAFIPGASNISAVIQPTGDALAYWTNTDLNILGMADGQRRFGPITNSLPIHNIDFSRDGRQLVTCYSDDGYTKCYARVWDLKLGTNVGDPLWHGDGVISAAFSPDRSRIVTGGEDSKAMVWKTGSSNRIAIISHENQVLGVCFNSKGNWIGTTSSDKTARVWSVDSEDPLTPPLRHHEAVFGVRFVADDYHLVTSDVHGHAWVWHLPREARKVEDLLGLSRLLSGNRTLQTVGLGPSHSESLEQTWQQLRSKHENQFQVSPQEVEAWHEFEAEESELQKEWPGAIFHLKRLLEIRPDDRGLKDRLATALQNNSKPN